MTTTTKKAKVKPSKRKLPPTPPDSSIITIAGREFLVTELDAYDDWVQDQLLDAVAADRIEQGRNSVISFEDAKKRLLRRKKSK